MTICPSADPAYVWTPQQFTKMIARVVDDELRAIAETFNREPDEHERRAVVRLVMGSIISQLTPAGNA